jgi:4-hydroxy-4-methyl-2-oxoglutarate aldolase
MPVTSEQWAALRRLGTCAVADAIEVFQLHLRNVGFADGTVRCCFEDLPPILGYASTARIRTAIPPMVGAEYADRFDWWTSIRTAPAPRIVVLEDVDSEPGVGALVGDVQGNVLHALGVVGVITNGAVRDLPQLHTLGLQCFAHRVVPSHAYAHVFEFDVPVRVGGLEVSPGDLIHADRHGVVKVPTERAAEIPAAADRLRRHNAAIVALCQSDAFTLESLRDLFASRDAASGRSTFDGSR